MRLSTGTWLAAAGLLGVLGGVGAWACAGGEDGPSWSLVTTSYESYGDSAILTPGNDTRVNLLLLLADRRDPARLTIRPPGAATPNAQFDWDQLAAQAVPPRAESDSDESTRCQTAASGAEAFDAALQANAGVPQAEKAALAAARNAFHPSCDSREPPAPALPQVQSAAGTAFAHYLAAAGQFYAGDFAAAHEGFAALGGAPDPWLRETALYMVARNALNAVQQASFDEYGDLVAPDKRDRPAIAASGAAFNAYLAAYPDGRYAGSARGLLRRVAWLAGDLNTLSAAYAPLLAGRAAPHGFESDVRLADEIDYKLLSDLDGHRMTGPVLLAVADLMRMRTHETACESYMSWCSTPITRAEIDAQREAFGSDTELFDYIRAAEAFFVRHQPREVLAIIHDAARQPSFGYVQFSRQMLRGFALQAVGDGNTRPFLLDLFGGANRPFQRDALELALAIHDEKGGQLGLVFAPESRVRNPFIRETLLARTAGPELLRQQANDAAASPRERSASLYILLSKELRHGLYADFLSDVRLVPAGAPTDGYYSSAEDYTDEPASEQIPLGIFVKPAGESDLGCPAVAATAATLASDPSDVRGRLCLADFMLAADFDWFPYDEPREGSGLASTRPLFPGPAYSRLEVYKAVMAERAAAPADKAYAIYRAIRCYAPSGNNSCGGTEVGLAQRKAWFWRLKRDYPASTWAKSLKFYW